MVYVNGFDNLQDYLEDYAMRIVGSHWERNELDPNGWAWQTAMVWAFDECCNAQVKTLPPGIAHIHIRPIHEMPVDVRVAAQRMISIAHLYNVTVYINGRRVSKNIQQDSQDQPAFPFVVVLGGILIIGLCTLAGWVLETYPRIEQLIFP